MGNPNQVRAAARRADSGSAALAWDVQFLRWSTDELLERITIDPNACFGKPTVRGTRIWVGLVLGLLADGLTVEDDPGGVPVPRPLDDVRACLAYGARLSVGHYVDVA